jgi:hydrogenase maturation protease
MLKVLGIGNTLRGDDGIGSVVIEALQKENLPESIQLFDIGSDAFSIIDHFENEQPVLVIDCAQMGKEPGEVIKFDVKDENLPILDKAISIHGFGFSDVYKMAKNLYENIQCTIIGVQPKSLEFNTGLSEEIKNKIPSIIKMVIEETNKHVKKNNHN